MRSYDKGDFKKLDDLILPDHEEFKDFIKYLVQIDPLKRPSAREALKHKFCKSKITSEYGVMEK